MHIEMKQYNEAAAVWIERSRKDYHAARMLKSKDTSLSIYLLEQCIEKSVKALAVASGEFTPEEIKKEFSHNSQELLIQLWQKLESNKSSSTLSSIFDLDPSDEDLFETLQLIKNLQSLSLFSTHFKFEENDSLKLSLQIKGKEFHFLFIYHMSPPSLILTELPSQTSKAKGLVDLALLFLIDSGMNALITKKVSDSSIIQANLESQFSRDRLFFSLFLLAALTYKHQASSRYPSSDKKNIGCQDYTENLPIVRHIELLFKIISAILPEVYNALENR
jgi:hypothetical protein